MRSRRQRLQVSTFPFLAVLLCAMGSLILLLLVIDRRARVVARAKAMQALEQKATQESEEDEAQRAEWERRRRLLHEQLALEEQELLKQVHGIQDKTQAIAEKNHGEQAQSKELGERFRQEQMRLEKWEAELTVRRTQVSSASQQADLSHAEMVRLTTELERLEQTLHDVRAIRNKQRQLYSLVPYRGKRGDNRKPLYLECAATALIFHPDRLALTGGSFLSGSALRAELDKRVEASILKTGDKAEANAYLLMLIRPDGITTYYRAVAALQGLKIDFGYEFVDKDWILDFPADDESAGTQTWMTAVAAMPNSSPSVSAKRVSGFRPAASGTPQAGGPATGAAGRQGGSLSRPTLTALDLFGTGVGNKPAVPSGGNTSEDADAKPFGVVMGSGERVGGTNNELPGTGIGRQASGLPAATGTTATAIGLGAPRAVREGESTAQVGAEGVRHPENRVVLPDGPGQSATRSVSATGNVDISTANSAPQRVQGSQAGGRGVAGNSGANSDKPGSETPSTPSASSQPAEPRVNAPGAQNGQKSVTRERGQEGASSPPDDGLPGAVDRLLPRGPRKTGVSASRPFVLVGNRDWVIAIDCTADTLVLSPSGKRIATSALTRPENGGNPLRDAVQELIARRQASVRPGEPPYRPMIKFRVRPEGLRSYYLAYPALEGLGISMSRESVSAEYGQ